MQNPSESQTKSQTQSRSEGSSEADKKWMSAYLKGDVDAFARLYSLHSSKVMGYLTKRLTSREEQEEVFQQAWMKFHTSRESYDEKYAVLQWLFVVTKSCLLDHWKKKKREPGLEFVETDVDHAAAVMMENEAETNVMSDWDEKLKILKPEQARVVSFRVREEMEFSEIAKRLGKSPTNIRQIFSRALRTLRLREKKGASS